MHSLEQLRSGALRGITRLDLSADLTELPPEVFALADTLEVLNLSGNRLTTLPDDLPRLHKLRVLFCSDNPFTELPPVLGRCPALETIGFKACRIEHVPAPALPAGLRWLILTDNRIEALPEAIGRCGGLHKLMLAGNRLRALPAALAQCRELELLRIAANQFEALPQVLTGLPRLSWLATAGNPFALRDEAAAEPAMPPLAIDWADLDLQTRLGEGASGVIHQARWRRPGGAPLPVAVKLFKGAMTSDGLPHCERAACLAAGTHTSLIPVLGPIAGHPEGAEGLALALVDPALRPLAGPPSLSSCTRDVYAPALTLSPGQALRLASDVAEATAHLHAQGLLHGDLYAHNILWDRTNGAALLGDFGAASFLPAQTDPARALTRMDVRALGVLLGELAERLDNPASPVATGLARLAATCQAGEMNHAPGAADVVARLRALA